MIKRNLGRMGETFFNNLCASVGLNCNGSTEDRTGWDFIVEFQHEYDDVILADKSPATNEFKIQIKATDKSKRKIAITLSNLMRLCNTPLPSFILILEYNNKSEPDDSFLVHINKDIIFNVLRNARMNSLDEERKNFNRKTLTIRYDEKNKLSYLTGDEFVKAINSYIPRGMNEYVKEKQYQIKRLGYEKGCLRMKFKTSILDPENDLVSASLGWIDKVKVTDVVSYDTRFEVLSKKKDLCSPEAIISFKTKESTDTGNISFCHLKSKKKLRFECEFYSSQISVMVPEEMAKFRIKSKSFDILVQLNGNSHFKFVDDKVRLSIFELRDAIIIRKWIFSQESNIEIKIFSDRHRKSFVITSNEITEKGFESNYINHLKYLEELVAIVLELARALNIESQIKMSFDELRNSEESLQSIAPLIRSNKQPYDNMKFYLDQKELNQKIKGEVVCIMVLSSTLGSLTVYAIISARGLPYFLDDSYVIEKPTISIEELIDCPSGENITPQINEFINLIGNNYSDEGFTTICSFNN